MNLRKLLVYTRAALLTASIFVPASFAQNFTFDFTDLADGVNATGTLDVSAGLATNGSVAVTGSAKDIGSFASYVQNPNPPNIAVANVPGMGGNVDFDDLVTHLNSQQVFDSQGVAFGSTYLGVSSHGTPLYTSVVNIWGNGGGSYTLAEFDSTGIPQYNGTLSLTEIPEPETYAAILGAAAFAYAMFQRKRLRA
jgi:hypothetical protein